MNKHELAAIVAKEAGLTQSQAAHFIDGFTASIRTALKKGNDVTLVGFGTFKVAKRAARMGVNPKTGEKMKIAARKVVKFVPGKDLRQAV
ncbi:MAG: HU family DNA-binding protein [Candidatus Riflebacteria bacterium]|nr:HU family DNA-binding protein [Candidatus Riflebacteria bacterium]